MEEKNITPTMEAQDAPMTDAEMEAAIREENMREPLNAPMEEAADYKGDIEEAIDAADEHMATGVKALEETEEPAETAAEDGRRSRRRGREGRPNVPIVRMPSRRRRNAEAARAEEAAAADEKREANRAIESMVRDDVRKNTQEVGEKLEEANAALQNRIFSETGVLQADTYERRRKASYEKLLDSYVTRRILMGEISKIRLLGKEGGKQTYVAVINYGEHQVIIPAHELMDMPPNMRPMSNPLRVMGSLMQKRLGAVVQFVVTRMPQQDEDTVLASRKVGMQYMAMKNYLGVDYNGVPIRGQRIVTEGSRVEGRVIIVNEKSVLVDLFGIEVMINPEEASWSRVYDLRTKFKNGQHVSCLIMSVNKNRNTNEIVVKASIKRAEVNPKLRKMPYYNVNDICRGTVSGVTARYIFVLLEPDVDIACKRPDRVIPPLLGDDVSVRISHKVIDVENPQLYGTLVNRD